MQFIDPTPGPSSDVAQVADPATAVTQDVPVSLPTTEIMKAVSIPSVTIKYWPMDDKRTTFYRRRLVDLLARNQLCMLLATRQPPQTTNSAL